MVRHKISQYVSSGLETLKNIALLNSSNIATKNRLGFPEKEIHKKNKTSKSRMKFYVNYGLASRRPYLFE